MNDIFLVQHIAKKGCSGIICSICPLDKVCIPKHNRNVQAVLDGSADIAQKWLDALPNCPQCGEKTETLYEGYCEKCRDERQKALNEYNACLDFWENLSRREKNLYIKEATK